MSRLSVALLGSLLVLTVFSSLWFEDVQACVNIKVSYKQEISWISNKDKEPKRIAASRSLCNTFGGCGRNLMPGEKTFKDDEDDDDYDDVDYNDNRPEREDDPGPGFEWPKRPPNGWPEEMDPKIPNYEWPSEVAEESEE